MNSATIREAGPKDCEDLLRLYAEFYNELRSRQGLRAHDLDEYREDVRRILVKDKVFLAEDCEGKPVGFIRVSRREGCHWFEELYVEPGYRGRGIGKKLVEAAERYVSEHDDFVYIMVLPQDRRAIRFWLHMGYRLLNTVELAKNLRPSGEPANKRPFPLLSEIVEIYRWAEEEYTQLEGQFLELAEEFKKRGGTGEELLRIFVDALRAHLKDGPR